MLCIQGVGLKLTVDLVSRFSASYSKLSDSEVLASARVSSLPSRS
jgi:hypothetical protein